MKLTAPLALFAALLPKCPMCIAAYLSALGLGGSATVLVMKVVALRPLMLTVALVLVLFRVLRWARLANDRISRPQRADRVERRGPARGAS